MILHLMLLRNLKHYGLLVLTVTFVTSEYLYNRSYGDWEYVTSCLMGQTEYLTMTEIVVLMSLAMLVQVYQAQMLCFMLENKAMVFVRYQSEKCYFMQLMKSLTANTALCELGITCGMLLSGYVHGDNLLVQIMHSFGAGFLFYSMISITQAVLLITMGEEKEYFLIQLLLFAYLFACRYAERIQENSCLAGKIRMLITGIICIASCGLLLVRIKRRMRL